MFCRIATVAFPALLGVWIWYRHLLIGRGLVWILLEGWLDKLLSSRVLLATEYCGQEECFAGIAWRDEDLHQIPCTFVNVLYCLHSSLDKTIGLWKVWASGCVDKSIATAKLLEYRGSELSIIASDEFAWNAMLVKYGFQVGNCCI